MTAPTYEDRLVLFIDFLGFKEHVERSAADPAFLGRIVHALRQLRKIGLEQEVFASQQMTHFSDSVVLSFRIDERSAVFWMLNQIVLAVISMAESGFLVRGAVTIGPLLHTPEVLIGPAMNEAYRLESTEARFPRVIIDPEVVKVARRHRSGQHLPEEEEQYVRKMLAVDEDDRLWLDYISAMAVTSAGCDPDAYPEYIEHIGTLIQTGLSNTDIRVLPKFLWLHDQYVRSLDYVSALPKQDTDEAEQQRTFVANLPRYEALVKAARRKCAAKKPA